MYLSPFLLLLASTAQAAIFSVRSPKFTITSSDGAELRSESLPVVSKASPPLSLGPIDHLKLTFQVVDDGTGKGVQPHQTFLRFYDSQSGEEGIQPVRVTSSGKAKFELNMAKPPISIPPTSTAPLTVTLILGSSLYAPHKIDLFDLYLPPSQLAPVHPEEVSFHPLPELHHTFRPDNVPPAKIISFVFAVLVFVAPWAALAQMMLVVSPKTPHLTSSSILPFALSLAAFEVLLVWYWVDLQLGQVLLYGSCLAFITLFTGKNALASLAENRTAKK
ncbi:hypothetical protein FISHEDRAFT_45365 [Fistulina hepatica ATCC 64428]|uniref:Ribophorin II n=1 Tax=Fistulina hepatica ATCC 64428 TaxID=1128425 RepID=A0A0D7ABV0_9AGAR|nr:hypothetical protein FISHEDRAFT_45365 [Fistulina hepatica ATCC 64428]